MIDSPRRLGLPGLVAVPGVLLLALVLGLGRGPEIPGGSVLRGSLFPAWLDRAGEASPEHPTSGAELERLLDRIPAPRFLVLDLDRLEESSLTRAAGIDELVGVALSGDGGDGRARRTLEALASLPRLAAIDLSECHGISDPDLDPLAWMRGLRSLTLGGFGRRTPVGDSTLARLAGSRVLQELSLVGCEVSATGLRAIGGMERLESLDLSDAEGASDLDYAELASLRRLEWLRLARTSAGDLTCRALADLPRLAVLILDRSGVGDEGLRTLSRCRSLRRLSLAWTGITVRGLAGLVELPHLEELDLTGCAGLDTGRLSPRSSRLRILGP